MSDEKQYGPNRLRAGNIVALMKGDGCSKADLLDAIESELDAAEQREREACARIADEWATSTQREHGNGGPAAAIRARGRE